MTNEKDQFLENVSEIDFWIKFEEPFQKRGMEANPEYWAAQIAP